MLGTWGLEAQALARGIDSAKRRTQPGGEIVGAEETFERDLSDRASLERHLLEQAARVAHRLCREELLGRVIVVKVKYSDFSIQSRRMTLHEAVGDTDSIFEIARESLVSVRSRPPHSSDRRFR